MSSTQLQEAVQLAQQGRRDDARRLLWQVVQSDSNNEMAWLWLASVAADQTEYQRALNEVLRINPNNGQARQLLTDLQKQQPGAAQPSVPPLPPAGSSGPTMTGAAPRPPQQYGTPPAAYPPSAYGQQQPPYGQTPPYGQPAQPPPYGQQPSAYGQPYGAPYGYPQQGYAPVQKRRGCGCLPRGCAIALVLLMVVPTLLCCILAYTPNSLGPFDIVAVYLPDRFGRKSVEFEDDNVRVKATVPRSWYPAVTGDIMWEAWRDQLNTNLPFEDTTSEWDDVEVDLDNGGSAMEVAIVETNVVTLMSGGAPILLMLTDISGPGDVIGATVTDFTCNSIRNAQTSFEGQSGISGSDVIELDDDLCALRVYSIEPSGETRIFQDYDAPAETRTVMMVIPIDRSNAATFVLSIPENEYDTFEEDLEEFIKTVDVTVKNPQNTPPTNPLTTPLQATPQS